MNNNNINRYVSAPMVIPSFREEKDKDSTVSSASSSPDNSLIEEFSNSKDKLPKLPSFKELFSSTLIESPPSSGRSTNDSNSPHSSDSVNNIARTGSSTTLTSYLHDFRILKDSNPSIKFSPPSPMPLTPQDSSSHQNTNPCNNQLKETNPSSHLSLSAPHITPFKNEFPFSQSESSTNNNAMPRSVNFFANQPQQEMGSFSHGKIIRPLNSPRENPLAAHSKMVPRKNQFLKVPPTPLNPALHSTHLLKKIGGSESDLIPPHKKKHISNPSLNPTLTKKSDPFILNEGLMSLATTLLLDNTDSVKWHPVKIEQYSPQIHIYNHAHHSHHVTLIHDRNQIYIKKILNVENEMGQILLRLIINLNIEHFIFETDSTSWYPADQWATLKAIYLLPKDYYDKILSKLPKEAKSLSFKFENEEKNPTFEWKVPSSKITPKAFLNSLPKQSHMKEDSPTIRPRSESAPVLYQDKDKDKDLDNDAEWAMEDQ